MWAHLGYLLAIPLVGVGSLVGITKHAGTANLGGWIIAAVYLAVQLKYYRLPRRLGTAVLTVSIVPLQVLAHVLLFGGGFADYFVEEAFVELSSLALALALVMIAYRPSGWGGAAVGVGLAAVAVFGFGLPLGEAYLRAGAGAELWILLGLVVASGTWAQVRLTAPAARFEVGEPSATGPGWLGRVIDRIAPSHGDDLEPGVSEGVVSALIVVQSLLWLIVPSLVRALL